MKGNHMSLTPLRKSAAGLTAGMALALAISACGSSVPEATVPGSDNGGAAPVEITLASQPNEGGFTLWLAQELGYFAENGLETDIIYAANGAALLGSGAAGDWQAGWIGSPPAITGYESFGLVSVGTMMREDRNLKLVMRAADLEERTAAEILSEEEIGTTTNSTWAQVLYACADHFGVDPTEMEIVPLDPPAVRQALQAEEVAAGTTDSSGDYPLLNETDDYEVVCDGEIAGVSIIDPYVVTPAFLEANPDAAAAYVEAVYRANEFIRDDIDAALEYMLEYYADAGIDGSPEAAAFSMSFRNFLTLEEALEQMRDGTSEETLTATAEFFVAGGAYDEVPDLASNFATGLEVIEAAAELRASR